MAILKQGTTNTRLYKLIASSDHVSLIAGVDSRVRLSKAGQTFAVSGGTTKSIGFGWYRLLLTATDCNTLGDLAFYITGTSADDTDFVDQVSARVNDDFTFPTTKGRSTDVSATGEVGIDWANIGSPTTAQNLSATNIDTDQVVASFSGAVNSVTSGVTVTTNNDKTGYSLSNPQAFNNTGTVFVLGGTVGKVTGTVATLTSNADKTGYSLSSPHTVDITGNITGNLSGSVGSVTGNLGGDVQGNVDGSVASVTGNVSGSVQNVISYVTVGTNNDKTGYSLSAGQLFVKKNTALANFMFPMIDSTDNVTLKTGLTVTGEVSIDGAAFGALTNSPTELASGVYKVDLAAADLNGTNIMLKFTATGGDTRLIELITQA